VTAIRSCVACGGREPQHVLLRMTLRDGRLCRDARVRATGRGAYLHDRDACWTAFVGRRGPVRSLRAPVSREVREALARELRAVTQGREG